MSLTRYTAAALVLGASSVVADSWGSAFSLGPTTSNIIATTTTIYPGKMQTGQEAYLFAWLGMSNGTGGLIQSIIGSYPSGGSECGGQTGADTTWCISSEVYDAGYQYVGELTTADVDYENGIALNYTLVDADNYLWLQTMSDAVTGTLLSTYNMSLGPMTGWGTALECDDFTDSDGTVYECTGTFNPQYYVDSTIYLAEADESFINTMGVGTDVVHTDMLTADGGKTWTIANITIPAMVSGEASSDNVASSVVAAVAVASTSAAVASSSVVPFEIAASSSISSVATASVVPFEIAASSSISSVATASVVPFEIAASSGAASPTGGAGKGFPSGTGGFASPTGGFGGFGGHKGGNSKFSGFGRRV